MPKEDFIKNFGEGRIKDLALDRAYGKSLKDLSSFYRISIPKVRILIEYAIVTPGVISDSIAIDIANVSCTNQFPHSKKIKTKPTDNYYKRLFAERRRNQKNQNNEVEENTILEKKNIPTPELDLDEVYNRFMEVQYTLDNFDYIYDCSSDSERMREDLEKEYLKLEKILNCYSS